MDIANECPRGRWKAMSDGDGNYWVEAPDVGETVCHIEPWSTKADAADAYLIAAAPDMAASLAPFADIDGEGDEDFPDSTPVVVKFGRTSDFTLTLGDFRRARAALHRAECGDPAPTPSPA